MAENVYWHPEKGGVCPVCSAERVPVTSSPAWKDGVKMRSHKCVCGETFQSIQMTQERRDHEAKRIIEAIGEHSRGIERSRTLLDRLWGS